MLPEAQLPDMSLLWGLNLYVHCICAHHLELGLYFIVLLRKACHNRRHGAGFLSSQIWSAQLGLICHSNAPMLNMSKPVKAESL
jgi:hypothetical protein